MNSLTKNLLVAALIGLIISAVIVTVIVMSAGDVKLSELDDYKLGELVGSLLAIPLICMGLPLGLWLRRRMGFDTPTFTPVRVVFGGLGGVLLAIGLIALSPKEASTQLNAERPWAKAGSLRDSFIRGALRSCIKTQRALPENKEVSDMEINSVCTCHANSLADTITREEFKHMEAQGSPSADGAKVVRASFERCAQNGGEKPAGR
jgi:hypothetical protein